MNLYEKLKSLRVTGVGEEPEPLSQHDLTTLLGYLQKPRTWTIENETNQYVTVVAPLADDDSTFPELLQFLWIYRHDKGRFITGFTSQKGCPDNCSEKHEHKLSMLPKDRAERYFAKRVT